MKSIFHFPLLAASILLFPLFSVAQQLKLGNNPSAINKASVLELESQNQGLLLTRIPDTTVATLTTAQDGTILFYKGDNSLRVRSAGSWKKALFAVDTIDIANFSVKVRSLFSGTAPITYNNGVIGISQASTSTNGYLSSADWNTFNNKLSSVDTTNIANFSGKVRSLFSGTAPITYNNGVIGISQASTSTNGYLSSADWNTFNNKLSSVDTTNIANFSGKVRSLFSGTAPITYNNGVIGISQASATTNGYLSSTDWNTFNNKLSSVDTTNIANFSGKVRSLFSGTAPITYNNGVIGISQASATTNGYLSSTDWNTFNNKLSSIDTTNIANFSGKVRSLFSGTAPITYNNGVIGISQASATTNGYLSSTDWNTFNNKLSSIDTTNIANFSGKVRSLFSGTAPITYANGVIGISQASATTNGYLSSTDWNTFNNKLSSIDTTNIANFSGKVRSLFSGTAPITYNNGVIGISQASATTNGYLSSTDWNTFNNKLSTIDTTNIANFYLKVRSLFSAGSGITYDKVNGTISFSGSVGGWLLGGNGVTAVQNLGTTTNFDLPFITNNTERMRINATGSVGIGSNAFNATNPERLLVDGGTSTSTNLIRGQGFVNGSLQMSLTNTHGGPNASSDIVAYANNGGGSNFIDMGITSAGNGNGTVIGGGNTAYLYATGNNFVIGNAASGKNLMFITGGTASTNEAMRIDGTGNVGIANTTPAAKLDVGGNFKLGASGTVVSAMIKSNFSLSDGTTNITTTSSLTKTATVTGANLNASVIVNPRTALPQGLAIAYSFISAANTITINFINTGAGSGGNQKLGSVTFDVTVINP
ncbi:beta strand repeat-containing protein [Chitinophaga sp. Ak27]|uniref:beta strand repeat-containing protein n=2 Tax=Chitinophaga TaxID=79328 RepID=UPI00145F72C1|nr:hypothetical protein [Chitinophaga sp. Ak27]NLU92271.1 hypothetical protein [Chitinophaga sp. Ak27]